MGKVLKVGGLALAALMVACSSPSNGPATGPAPNVDATVQVAVPPTLQTRADAAPIATAAPTRPQAPTTIQNPTATPPPTTMRAGQPSLTPAPSAGDPTPELPAEVVAAPAPLVVNGGGAEGVSLRATPGTGNRLKVLEDGTELISLGDEREADGRLWKHVKDGDGTEGWVASEFLGSGSASVEPGLAPPVASDPTPVAASTAAAPAVPPYEWIDSALTSQPSRTRYSTEVVMPPMYTDDQATAVLADAVRRTFREKSDARAVVVFGYSSSEQVGKRADKGRALASQDGLGWTGDKTFLTFMPRPAPDDGKIYVTLGLGGPGPNSERAVDR